MAEGGGVGDPDPGSSTVRASMGWEVRSGVRQPDRIRLMANCPFCEERQMKEREFYRRGSWYAVLDHKPMTRGHVLLVVRLAIL